jgi:hypothetical protein
MFRSLLLAISILHLGPGIAFALMALGCDGESLLLAEHCVRGGVAFFAQLTALVWLLLTLGLATQHLLGRTRRAMPPGLSLRLAALGMTIAFGASLAGATLWLTGSSWGFAAIPASMAWGWLNVANPLACVPDKHQRGNG